MHPPAWHCKGTALVKPWIRWTGSFLAIACSVAFIIVVLRTLDFASVREHINVRSVLATCIATLLYAMVIPLSALAWQRILSAVGHRERLFPLLAIIATTQAGKYLPGNIGHHVGRVGLAVTLGIPLAILVASMAYEVVLLLLAHLLIALGSGALSKPGLALLLQADSGPSALLIAAGVAAAGLAVLPLLSRILPWLTGLMLRRRKEVGAKPRALPIATMLQVVGIYGAAMLLTGSGLAVLSLGLLPGEPVDYALLVAAFTLTWTIGFVTPGAPAGLGIREGALLLVLSHSLGTGNATLLILMLRIATTLGDLLAFVAGLAILPRARAMLGGKRQNSATAG